MLKKVSHIILSLLIVVSTTGLTYTKHYCKAQSVPDKHVYVLENLEHDYYSTNHDSRHAYAQNSAHKHQQMSDDCISDKICVDEPCCDNETCHDDNCCKNELQTIKLSLDYIKIETKEITKVYKIELFHTELIVFNNLFNESSIIGRYIIADSPTKIKNAQSFLQTFRC